MSTYTQIVYHVVFSTKERVRVLLPDHRKKLWNYMWGVLKNKQCHLYQINGVEDHVHLLMALHPSIALADFVKDLKIGSSIWLKECGHFPGFTHWQDGYAAFTCSAGDIDDVVKYIKGQEEHHRVVSFKDELRALLVKARVKFDERYLV